MWILEKGKRYNGSGKGSLIAARNPEYIPDAFKKVWAELNEEEK